MSKNMEYGMYKFDYDLKPHKEVPENLQQVAYQSTIEHHEERSAHIKGLSARLGDLAAGYAQVLRSIIGDQKLEQLRASRCANVDAGVDMDRVANLRAEHEKKILSLEEYTRLETTENQLITEPPPCQGESGDWVVYSPPYPGSFWSYEWSRSDEPDDPVLTRYLDQSTGQIGSSIHTRLIGADDDDFVNVDYYTAFKMWHQVREAGYLEGYLALRVANLDYSLTANDEWGFSTYYLTQITLPQMRILAPDGTWEVRRRIHYNLVQNDGGAHPFFNWVFPTSDIHWFYFRSKRIHSAGSWVLLEAALQNGVWYTADDYSITTDNEVDLRLDRVAVRSVPEVIT